VLERGVELSPAPSPALLMVGERAGMAAAAAAEAGAAAERAAATAAAMMLLW